MPGSDCSDDCKPYAKITVIHREEYGFEQVNRKIFIGVKLDLKAEKAVMNAEQIKDEIRKLSRIDKIEIYRRIDEEAAADLLSRIGVPGRASGHASPIVRWRTFQMYQSLRPGCRELADSSNHGCSIVLGE